MSPRKAASKAPETNPDPCPEQVAALATQLADYLPEAKVQRVVRAYQVGAKAHHGQTRRSGEAYITHPVAVASILAGLRLDDDTLVAAILHDTLEDTKLSPEELRAEFGDEVAELVDGVTKLDKLQFRDRYEAATESFRKMMMAMAKDLRVILIKLADRLHNMRTLDAMTTGSRRRIARETLDIYAPIAQRLGMNQIKAELQDLGFRALYPVRYKTIAKKISTQPSMRREVLASIERRMTERLKEEGIPFRLVGRIKSPWSIYTKMKEEQKSLDQVLDVLGFRLIVQSVPQCYHALGAVHSLFKPLDARFRDFIAIPKANGYQSLHTVLFGPHGAPIEVQIRTEEMDMVAERGIAAHWSYKDNQRPSSNAQLRAQNWVRGLMEEQKAEVSSLEFLENVKVDLFPDEVYLFTPKGDILSLPRNATALDFAYAVHTDVGNHAVASRVDKKLVPLRTKLASGQSVEIISAPSAQPSPQWLEYVVTSKARTAIRHHLKRLQHEDAVSLGHRMLDRALEVLDFSLERVQVEQIAAYLQEHHYPRLEALLADIALGNRTAQNVAQTLVFGAEAAPVETPMDMLGRQKVMINGSERGILTFSNCCHPIPGDEIIGFLSAGKGIVVHRQTCPNIESVSRNSDRLVPMDWDREVKGDYRAVMRIEVVNKPGVLAQVAAAIAASSSNIDSVQYLDRDLNVSMMEFGVEVRDSEHLVEVIRRLRRLGVVHSAERA